MRTVFALLLAVGVAAGDEKADLKKQIADAEKKLAVMKTKLAKLEGEPTEFKNVGSLFVASMKVGERGKLVLPRGDTIKLHSVDSVLDDTTIVMNVDTKLDLGQVVVADYPAKGVVDGAYVIGPKTWDVIGTRKVGGRTLFVLREAK
jgi:hypothetical protein